MNVDLKSSGEHVHTSEAATIHTRAGDPPIASVTFRTQTAAEQQWAELMRPSVGYHLAWRRLDATRVVLEVVSDSEPAEVTATDGQPPSASLTREDLEVQAAQHGVDVVEKDRASEIRAKIEKARARSAPAK